MNYRTWATVVAGLMASAADAQTPTFEQKLLASRSSLQLTGERMTGAGADLLRREVAESRFVMVGEGHGTREIPAFVKALCAMVGGDRLSAYVVESGPIAAAQLAPMLTAPDRAVAAATFARTYPNAVAFLDIAGVKRRRRASAQAGAATSG